MQKIAEQETVKKDLSETAEQINAVLREIMDEQSEIEPRLKEAMEYALFGEGKRARAAVILWVCRMISGQVNEDAKMAAAAMEMVHTYSLVHDDLPAMDDDDLRRGRPTVHKQFDEATAILTGDGLLTLAFEILSTQIPDSNKAVKMVGILSWVAGPSGMVAGQMADMLSENGIADIDTVNYIHNNKTAMMFSGAAAMGAIAAGASNSVIATMTLYGLKIGLGFQVSDDILDITATTSQMGKTVGKDKQQSKATYPAVLGIEKSKQAAEKIADEALTLLDEFGDKADVLRGLIFILLNRTK
jgi:geranylgeranyl diphosphate synthase, type II